MRRVGVHCYNWNLGNVKPKAGEQYMYLHGVWELDSPQRAQADVEQSGGLAHIASAAEISKHGWSCSAGKNVVVFEPPHPQARFRAYGSLQEGIERWVGHHRATAQKHPEIVSELNSGDCGAVAKTLKQVHYYTGDEGDYAKSMTSNKATIDRELGAIK